MRLPPANDLGLNGVDGASGAAPTTPSPPPVVIETPPPFFPRKGLFPFSRPSSGSAGYSGSRLPPRQPIQPLANVVTVEAPSPHTATEPSTAAPPSVESSAQASAPSARVVAPPRPPVPASPPVRIIGPAQQSAASSNEYSERLSEREAHRYGRRTEVVQPETFLVHAWAFALTAYPPSALTVWMQSTQPAESPYSFYIRGDELAGDPFPDRKLYEAIRARRKKPQVAEAFSGRIRGLSAEGQVLDVGGGFIELPPEAAPASSPWGPAAGVGTPSAAWGYGPGAPPGGSPWGPGPWGAPPPWAASYPAATHPSLMSGPWGAWGPPPPWWAQYPGGQPQGPQAPAPPAAIAHDPGLIELWKGIHELQSMSLRGANEAQASVAKAQGEMLSKLLERALDRPAQGSGGGGSMKETLGLLGETVKLVKELQGDSGGSGLVIQEVGKDKIFSSGGKLNTELTAGFAIKDGLTDLIKGVAGRMKPPTPAATAVASASGSALPPKRSIGPGDGKPNGAA